MDSGSNHAADDGRGNRLHDIGADAGFPEDWSQAGKNGADGHELWPQTMDSAFDGRGLYVSIGQRSSALKLMFESFMKINDHDHAGFDRDPKERNITNGHGDAKVIVEKPLQK